MLTSLLLLLLLQTAPNVDAAGEAFRAGSAAADKHDLQGARAEFERVVKLAPQVSAGHSALGTVLLELGDVKGALEQLRAAHELDPRDLLAAANLATALTRDGQFTDALPLFAAVAGTPGARTSASAPFTPDTLSPENTLAYAAALAGTGRTEDARALLSDAATAAPGEWRYEDGLGSLLASEKKYPDAREHFSRAIAVAPNEAQPHLHMGSIDLLESRTAEALDELAVAVRLAPDDLQAQLQMARTQLAAGNNEAALAALRKARELSPTSDEVAYETGLALVQAGRPGEALPLLAAIESKQTKGREDPGVLTNYALALVQSGSADKAIPLYRRVLARDPADALVHEDLGVAYLQQNDLDHAISEFEAGLAAGKNGGQDAVLHYDLGLAWKLKDQLPKATAELELAETLDASLPDPPYTLGIMHMQAGQFAEAAAELEKTTTLRPDNGLAWAALGSVYKQLGQQDKALAALREAIRLLPAQPGPHVLLGAILAEQGQKTEAAAERKQAADLTRVAVSRQKAEFALRTGRALLDKGDTAGALAQLQTAVDADPGYPAAHKALAEAFEREHRGADAALERQKAEQLERPGEPTP